MTVNDGDTDIKADSTLVAVFRDVVKEAKRQQTGGQYGAVKEGVQEALATELERLESAYPDAVASILDRHGYRSVAALRSDLQEREEHAFLSDHGGDE